ncbi:MAG: alanine racemase [Melioribacteraceae bacterium]|nr:alanine racemase [Melioribacteraceae bacterium]MCF8263463.1 alanine racemase [Melioribacteraceae bacterium]MCF8430992.1 alanine racemase [Melioribacteraceae bacterium]
MIITKPTLLFDKKRAARNLFRMAGKAKKHNLKFRPHFKTHQSAEVGELFKDYGINSITVSSVTMAEYFANHGWKDILIAFPVNILEINSINRLASKIKLSLLVESVETVEFLSEKLNANVLIYIKIDCGYHRTGVAWNNNTLLTSILSSITSTHYLKAVGFLTHSGQTYHAKNSEEVLKIHNDSITKLKELKSKYSTPGGELIVSVGDTPSCSVAESFPGVDEIRPGNFIFYDVMQSQIGSCLTKDIAVGLAVPVVAKHPERNEIIVYGGAVHLSKDFGMNDDGTKNFGLVAKYENGGWGEPLEETFVSKLSQEHGTIHSTEETINEINVGDVVVVLPYHSCLTVDAMRYLYSTDGKEISTYLSC